MGEVGFMYLYDVFYSIFSIIEDDFCFVLWESSFLMTKYLTGLSCLINQSSKVH